MSEINIICSRTIACGYNCGNHWTLEYFDNGKIDIYMSTDYGVKGYLNLTINNFLVCDDNIKCFEKMYEICHCNHWLGPNQFILLCKLVFTDKDYRIKELIKHKEENILLNKELIELKRELAEAQTIIQEMNSKTNKQKTE